MSWKSSLGRLLLGLGIAGVGVVGLKYGDFVRAWQPVPTDLPFHGLMAAGSALLLLVSGAGLLVRPATGIAALVLCLFLLSWIVVLHGPLIAAHPNIIASWGHPASVLAVAAGCLVLWTTQPILGGGRLDSQVVRGRLRFTGRLLFALALLGFGIGHLAYASNLASLVPASLPLKTGIVYFTGCAHIAAGLALVFGIFSSLAATLEAAMLMSFVLLVDLPRLITGRVHGPPWALFFETALVGAAWIVAGSPDASSSERTHQAPTVRWPE